MAGRKYSNQDETRRILNNNVTSIMSEAAQNVPGLRGVITRGVNQFIGMLPGDHARQVRHGINIDKAKKKKAQAQ